jgi:MFS transporter, DHA1 family, tetracycline resistance protein
MSAGGNEAREEAKAGGPALAVLLLVVFVNLVGFGILLPLLPYYAQSFDAPAWQVTWIFTAFSVGNFFAEPIWGRLSDRIGRKPILLFTVFCSALGFAALAFAPNIWMALLLRFFGGLTTGNLSTIQGYIADVTPPEKRAGRMGYLGAAYGVGFVIGPAIGGFLAHEAAGSVGFRLPLLVAAGMSFIAAFGILAFVKESRTKHARAQQTTPHISLKQAAAHPVLGRILIVTFLFITAFAAAESIFGLWTQKRFGWGPKELSLCFSAVALTAALAQGFITGRLTRRYGEAAMLTTGLILLAGAMALQPLGQGQGHTIALLAFAVVGQSLILPNLSALLSRTTSPDSQGAVLGLNQAMGALARAAGPIMGGALFSIVGPSAPFYAAALLAAPAAILALQAEAAARKLRSRL